MTLDHVQLLSQVGLTYNDRSTKVTVMSILGRLGKLTLDRQEEGGADILQGRIQSGRILVHYVYRPLLAPQTKNFVAYNVVSMLHVHVHVHVHVYMYVPIPCTVLYVEPLYMDTLK